MPVNFFCFYMFASSGECLQYVEWSRPRARKNAADDAKMMFGLLFSLNGFAAKVDPTAPPAPPGSPPARRSVGFRSFRTNTYKLHYLELPSGVQLALCTDPGAPDLRDALRHVYSQLYVELIVKSPLHQPGKAFVSEPFVQALQRHLRTVG